MNRMNRFLDGFFLALIYTLFFIFNQSSPDKLDLKIMGAFAIVELIYIYYSWYKSEKSLFNGYIVFVTAYYAFNLGQPMLEVFNLVSYGKSILLRFDVTNKVFFEATYLGMLFILFMHFGALLALNKLPRVSYIDKDNAPLKILSIYKVSLILSILSFPLFFYELYSNLSIVIRYGYMAIYDNSLNTVPRVIQLLSAYYEPSIIALFFSSCYLNKNKTLILAFAIVTILVPPLILGGRSNAMIIAALLLIVYALFNKINIKRLGLIAAAVIVLLVAFSYIATTRLEAPGAKTSYSEALEEVENPILFTLSEMGWSMTPLCWCLDIFPNQIDYKYGDSFLYSFTTIIPNLGFWKYHPAKIHSNLGEWLMDYKQITYGPGFSIAAEAYVNFGYFGFLFFFIYGFLITKSFRFINKKYIDVSPFVIVASLIFLWFSIKTVRNSFLGTVRALFYYTLPMYWLFKYYYNQKFNRIK